MLKAELIKEISEKNAITKKMAAVILSSLEGIIMEELQAGNAITLPGIGTLKIVDRAARTACNPKTGEKVNVPAKKAIKFQASKGLKDAMKNVQ